MRRIAALTFLTLDGVMQAPGHAEEDVSGGFRQGGWATPFWGDVMAQVIPEAMTDPYDLLLGRRTYDSFASHWPNTPPEDPIGGILNRARKYVVTSGDAALGWQNSQSLSGDVLTEIRELKQQSGPLLQVHGSAQLLQTLIAHDLVDEFRLWIFPVAVGQGKRLFEAGTQPANFILVKTASTASGVIMAIYRRRTR